MAQALNKSKPGIDHQQIIEAFKRANQYRLQNTRELLNHKQKPFLELLPFLFHYNHPALPGFVSHSTPSGISQYSPLQPAINKAKHLFDGYKHERRAKHQMDICSLFIMGSAGTIAYTSKSDFDIWLIHSKLDAFEIDELSQKARLIEQWAETLRLEVHFFIFDSESFRSGQHQSLSTESSGSTQHSLLLDEFYRSSILVAGRFPVWWMVPPENEHQYSSYIDMLFFGNIVSENDVIDLGSPFPVPTSEYFSAAVWQLYKGITSPYKSVLKLLLMEVYASQFPNIELLSSIFKRYIYQYRSDPEHIDPYIILYKTVENYLMERGDKDRLDIFRECFYFKIGEKLSYSSNQYTKTSKRQIIENMMLEWGWDRSNFSKLDMYDRWKIDNIRENRKNVITTLQKSYRFLSEFARKNAELFHVNQSELNILGRKLYATFEKKNHKIEIANPAFKDILESEVTLVESLKNGSVVWSLYRGKLHTQEITDYKPLKRDKNLFDLLVWCHKNRIVNYHSAILLHTIRDPVTTREIKDIFYALDTLFPEDEIYHASFDDLSNPARIIASGLFINLGIDPLNQTQDNIRHVASSRQDALSYGGKHENLVRTMSMVILTSWEEVLVYNYDGNECLFECLKDYLSWNPTQELLTNISLQVFSLSSTYGKTIAERVKTLFKDIQSNIIKADTDETNLRYVVKLEDDYYTVEAKHNYDKVRYHNLKDEEGFIKHISSPMPIFTHTHFDQNSHWLNHLPKLYALNQNNVIQSFFTREDEYIKHEMIDEKGSYFFEILEAQDLQVIVTHLTRFYHSIKNRRIFMLGNSEAVDDIKVSFYQLSTTRNQQLSVTKLHPKSQSTEPEYTNLQVIGSMDDDEKNYLTIYCDNEEFSSLEYGDEVLTVVAEHVLNQRNYTHLQYYPIYITDIDFSRNVIDLIEPKNIQTIHYMRYKQKIEKRLLLALKDITDKKN